MDSRAGRGVVVSALHISQSLWSTIQGLHTLRRKLKEVDASIRLIIRKLSTSKATVFQIRYSAELNPQGSSKERQFMNGLYVAPNRCQAPIDALSEAIKTSQWS